MNDVEYLKTNGVDVDMSLELLGDIDMYNETLNDFLLESETRLSRLEKNKNEKNLKDYAIDSHAMKSDSKYLGFKKLAELSYNHELEGKDNNQDYIDNHYDELMSEVNRIIKVISIYLGR